MLGLGAAILAAVFVVGPLRATAQQSSLSNNNHYVNSSGQVMHSPAQLLNGEAPVGASARCAYGSYSFGELRRGTCSRHGGVAAWL